MTRARSTWFVGLVAAVVASMALWGCTGSPERLEGLGARCARDRDCGGKTPVCGYNGYCVQCESAAECHRDRPYCTASGFCVECLSNEQCGGDAPFCDARLDRCVQCTRNSDCRVTEACSPEGECVPRCETNADCDEDEVCSGNACVGCGAQSNCGGDAPFCDMQKRACIECRNDSDCGAAHPVCYDGQCRDCIQNLDCELTELCNEDLECVGD